MRFVILYGHSSVFPTAPSNTVCCNLTNAGSTQGARGICDVFDDPETSLSIRSSMLWSAETMALTSTMYRVAVNLSDVDRSVYESLDVRLACHPSETMRYMLTRLFAYCLSYQEGIAFSKGGLSSADEPPLTVRDATGLLLSWIEIGSPSAERLHRATKAAKNVLLYSSTDLSLLKKEARTKDIYKLETIDVLLFRPDFLDTLDPLIARNTQLEVTRTEGQLYVVCGAKTIETTIVHASLVESEP